MGGCFLQKSAKLETHCLSCIRYRSHCSRFCWETAVDLCPQSSKYIFALCTEMGFNLSLKLRLKWGTCEMQKVWAYLHWSAPEQWTEQSDAQWASGHTYHEQSQTLTQLSRYMLQGETTQSSLAGANKAWNTVWQNYVNFTNVSALPLTTNQD